MPQHDYVIDNQTTPSFRSDLNNALSAIVTQNSGGTAPSTTYANMLWYDTANNQIKKRNEANSAWVILGTIDEGAGTFTPTGQPAIATQAQAEAGTNNTALMTPLRTSQAIAAVSAALVAGGVGTYMFASSSTASDVAFGSTRAGSALTPTSAIRSVSFSGGTNAGSSAMQESATVDGTWRCMGYFDYTAASGTFTGFGATLWLRIS